VRTGGCANGRRGCGLAHDVALRDALAPLSLGPPARTRRALGRLERRAGGPALERDRDVWAQGRVVLVVDVVQVCVSVLLSSLSAAPSPRPSSSFVVLRRPSPSFAIVCRELPRNEKSASLAARSATSRAPASL
jgi:hypothetical protein